MTQLTRRKPLYWILFDLIGTLLLLAGMFKLVDLEIPYISDFFRDFSSNLLLTVGGVIIVTSFLLFIIPVIKANKEKPADTAVNRSKR